MLMHDETKACREAAVAEVAMMLIPAAAWHSDETATAAARIRFLIRTLPPVS